MSFMIKLLIIPIIFFSSACGGATKSFSTERSAPGNHYTEHTCLFGKYGYITVHEGGIDNTYIIVNQKRYASYGGENFVQSKDNVDVVMMFNRRGELSYQGEIAGRNCHVMKR